tara:strand:- start:1398 stop:1532 length:135 start_codon:yes stop_codon:yes gene_type:complete
MKQLENYGVQALSTEEVKETQGGWVFAVIGIYLVIAAYAHSKHH